MQRLSAIRCHGGKNCNSPMQPKHMLNLDGLKTYMWKAKLSELYKERLEDVFPTYSEVEKGIWRQKTHRSHRKRLVSWLYPNLNFCARTVKWKDPLWAGRRHLWNPCKEIRALKKMKTTVEKQKMTSRWRRSQINLWQGCSTSLTAEKRQIKMRCFTSTRLAKI